MSDVNDWKKKLLDHLEKKSHVWIIVPSVATIGGYLWYAIAHGQPEQQLTANVVYAIIAAFAVFGGAISVFIMAFLQKEDFGKVADLRAPILLGACIGAIFSAIKLLGLFGLIHAAAVAPVVSAGS
jgi:hypothetical protein